MGDKMIKKLILLTYLISANALFANTDNDIEMSSKYFQYNQDEEISNIQYKFLDIKLGDVYNKNSKEIKYMGEVWFKAKDDPQNKIYIQKDPLTNKISKIRIISEFSEYKTGRDFRYLKNKYGEPRVSPFDETYRYYDENDQVLMYVDKDLLAKNFITEKNKVVIDISGTKENIEKKISDHQVYLNQKMIRK